MIYGMYLSAHGAMVQDARQDFIANNLANANTTGYKRDVPLFSSRLAEALENPESAGKSLGVLDAMGGGVIVGEMFTNFSEQGPAEMTGGQFDLRIEGTGYFGIVDQSGKRLYTRAGNFSRDDAGFLSTMNGKFRVLTLEGEPVEISDMDFKVAEDGAIIQGGKQTGRIMVVDLPDTLKMIKVGENNIEYSGTEELVRSPDSRVHQHQLEGSTVNMLREIVDMVRGRHQYNINMRMLSLQDETLGRAVNDIATT